MLDELDALLAEEAATVDPERVAVSHFQVDDDEYMRILKDLGDRSFTWQDYCRPREWRGCLLVNPLCPSDLCILPHDHPGTAEGFHILGTDVGPFRWIQDGTCQFMAPETIADWDNAGPGGVPQRPTTIEDLMQLGWIRQMELFPEESYGY